MTIYCDGDIKLHILKVFFFYISDLTAMPFTLGWPALTSSITEVRSAFSCVTFKGML